jgi:outer membrane protein OmpA-like peptidoglycan-associated protein
MQKIVGIFVFLIMYLIMSSCNVKAQSIVTKKDGDTKAIRLYKRGVQYMNAREPSKALADFEKAIKLEPNFIDAHIELGAYYYAQKDFVKAETSFRKAIDLDPNYKARVHYTYALAIMGQKRYSEAVEAFEAFLAMDSKYEKLNASAKKHITSSKFKAENNNRNVPFDPKPLGAGVNSTMHEYLPSITADEESLIITRNDGRQEDFYVSEKIDGVWTEAFPLTSINNPQTNEGAQSISQDGKLLFYTVCEGRNDYGGCDIYFAEVVNGKWTKAKNMGPTINGPDWDTQPCISADKRNLYYTSKRKGSEGGSDIWMSTRADDGSWGKPVNLGATINTPGNEASPFIHPDNQTLYFMSNGHPGFGKDDIFYARRQEDGSWGQPTNLGYPINTAEQEGSLIVSANGKTAYFATDRFNKENNNRNDIYSFELYEEARPQPVTYVKAKIIDAQTKKPLGANLDITDLTGQKSYYQEVVDEQGIFLVPLPIGKQYAMNVNKEAYLFHSENFALESSNTSTDPFLMIIPLQKIPPMPEPNAVVKEEVISPPVVLKNVFFETASADLKPISKIELDRLYNLLKEQTDLRIQINGHTDDVGNDDDNMALSVARAKAVFEYLVSKGIESSRMRSKGFGETMPVASNDTKEGKRQNRRTEFQMIN